MRILIPFVSVLLLAAPAVAAQPDPEARLAKMVAGRTPGAPIDCITMTPVTRSTTIETLGIVYEAGSTLYLNRFDGGCPQLDWDAYPVTRLQTGQLCRGDIALIQSNSPPGTPRGSCVFGTFTPYAKPR